MIITYCFNIQAPALKTFYTKNKNIIWFMALFTAMGLAAGVTYLIWKYGCQKNTENLDKNVNEGEILDGKVNKEANIEDGTGEYEQKNATEVDTNNPGKNLVVGENVQDGKAVGKHFKTDEILDGKVNKEANIEDGKGEYEQKNAPEVDTNNPGKNLVVIENVKKGHTLDVQESGANNPKGSENILKKEPIDKTVIGENVLMDPVLTLSGLELERKKIADDIRLYEIEVQKLTKEYETFKKKFDDLNNEGAEIKQQYNTLSAPNSLEPTVIEDNKTKLLQESRVCSQKLENLLPNLTTFFEKLKQTDSEIMALAKSNTNLYHKMQNQILVEKKDYYEKLTILSNEDKLLQEQLKNLLFKATNLILLSSDLKTAVTGLGKELYGISRALQSTNIIEEVDTKPDESEDDLREYTTQFDEIAKKFRRLMEEFEAIKLNSETLLVKPPEISVKNAIDNCIQCFTKIDHAIQKLQDVHDTAATQRMNAKELWRKIEASFVYTYQLECLTNIDQYIQQLQDVDDKTSGPKIRKAKELRQIIEDSLVDLYQAKKKTTNIADLQTASPKIENFIVRVYTTYLDKWKKLRNDLSDQQLLLIETYLPLIINELDTLKGTDSNTNKDYLSLQNDLNILVDDTKKELQQLWNLGNAFHLLFLQYNKRLNDQTSQTNERAEMLKKSQSLETNYDTYVQDSSAVRKHRDTQVQNVRNLLEENGENIPSATQNMKQKIQQWDTAILIISAIEQILTNGLRLLKTELENSENTDEQSSNESDDQQSL